MATYLQMLEGGFSQEEARQYISRKRDEYLQAGFTEDEVNSKFGLKRFDETEMKQKYIDYMQSIREQTMAERAEKVEGVEEDVPEHIVGLPPGINPKELAKRGMDMYIEEDQSFSYADSFETGLESSVSGLATRGKLPDLELPETMSTGHRIASGLGSLLGDFPSLVMGALAGGPNPITAGAGAFALTEGMRELYMQKLTNGEVTSFEDFWSRFVSVGWEAAKGYTVGAVTTAAGKVAPGIASVPAEVTAMVSAGAVLEGRVPEPHEFVDAAILVGGLKGARHYRKKLTQTYAERNKRPGKIIEDMRYEESIREDLSSSNLPIPRKYQKPSSDQATLRPAYNDVKKVMESVNLEQKGKPKTIKEKWDAFYTGWVDKFHPLKAGMKNFDPNDPYYMARLMAGISGKAEHWIKFRPFRAKTLQDIPGSKSLQQALDPVKNHLDEFRAYLVSKRAWELEAEFGIKTGVNLDSAARLIQNYELRNKNLRFQKVREDLQAYQNHLLDYLKDSGVVNAKSVDVMRTLNQYYVPFYRVKEVYKGSLPKGTKVYNIIKRIKGSEADIIDPLESVLKNTHAILALAERNMVNQAIADKFGVKVKTPTRLTKVTSAEIEKLIGDVADNQTLNVYRPNMFAPEGKYLTVWRNGKREFYEVPEEVLRVHQGMDQATAKIIPAIIAKPTQWLRAGAVLSPDFMAKNPVRDQFAMSTYSKFGYVFGSDMMKGMASLVKQDKYYQEWIKSGGANATLVSMDRNYLQGQLTDLYKLPVRNAIKEMNPLAVMEGMKQSPVESLRMLTEFSENITRLSEFRLGREKGASIKEAGYWSRQNPQDFQRMGASAAAQATNQLVAFFNAQIQGIDRFREAMVTDPTGTMFKMGTYLAVPSLLLGLYKNEYMRNFPDSDMTMALREKQAWEKDLYWLIPDPVTNTIVRIPKPFDTGILFGSTVERFVDYLYEKEPDTNFMKYLYDQGMVGSIITSITPGFTPTAAIPFVEAWANRKIFFDTPVVPASMERLLPELQATANTSNLLKAVSAAMGMYPPLRYKGIIAPANLENFVRSWTGGLGSYVLRAADYMIGKSENAQEIYRKLNVITPQRPTGKLADFPVIRTFVSRYPSLNTRSLDRFYTQREQIMMEINSINFRLDNAPQTLQEDKNQFLVYKQTLNGLSRTIDEQIRVIHMYNYMELPPVMVDGKQVSGEQHKRELIDKQYMTVINLARHANSAIESMKEHVRKLSKEVPNWVQQN